MDQHGRGHRIDVDLHRLDRGRVDAMFAPQVDQRVDGRVGRGARGIQLHGDAALDDLPAPPEPLAGLRQIPPGAPHRDQEALRAVDGPLRGGERFAREERRQYPVARGQPALQRFDHRPEVLLQAARLGRGDGQRPSRRLGVEPHDARRRGGGADGADGRGAVPTLLVMGRVHHQAEGAFDLETDDVGIQQRPSGGVGRLARGQSRGDQRCARMRQRHPAHVVEVERVGGGAVGERGVGRTGGQVRAEHAACAPAPVAVGERDPLHDAGGRLPGAGQRDADRVLDRIPRRGAGGGRNLDRRDEVGESGDGGHRCLPPERIRTRRPACYPPVH